MDAPTETGTAYRWSTLTEGDVPAWARLVNHLAVVDGTEEFYEEGDLREDLEVPHHDPTRDTWAVWDGEELVAYGAVFVPLTPDHEGLARAYLNGGVHGDRRRAGLGTALMERLEARARELLAERHPGTDAYFATGGGLEGSSGRALMEARGYAVVRYFNLLTRPLGDHPAVPELEGVDLRSPCPEDEQQVLEAHNAAFRDHWGSGPFAPESWHQHWTSRSSRPDMSTVAVGRGGDLDGRVLAYVLVGQWVDRQAYVNLVGTLPEARGRGLAAASLARTIALASASGDYDVIELDVDSDSPTGATRLYERVGFVHKHQTSAMRRTVA